MSRDTPRAREPLPEVPSSLVLQARLLPPYRLDVSTSDVPVVPGVNRCAEWVIAGPCGAAMHTDEDLSRFSVLLVVHGSEGWEVDWLARDGRVCRDPARTGSVLLIDVWKPHALRHEDGCGCDDDAWIALSWPWRTRAAAERARDVLLAYFRVV